MLVVRILLWQETRETFPYSIECKNQEKINLWESYKQATENSGKYEPVVFIKRNNHKPLVVVDADYFINLHKNTWTSFPNRGKMYIQ